MSLGNTPKWSFYNHQKQDKHLTVLSLSVICRGSSTLYGIVCSWDLLIVPRDLVHHFTWWRHQMGTFSASLAFCPRNSPVTGEFPSQRPVTRSFDVFFDPRLKKRLSKQSWGWWFEMLSRSLWRHCDVNDELVFMRKSFWGRECFMPGGI